VLNPNLAASEALYAQRAPDARLLLGPRYTPLREEFDTLIGSGRRITDVARKILVTLSGVEAESVRKGVARIRRRDLEVRVADAQRLLQLIERADAVVAAADAGLMELACAGLPAL